MKEGRFDMRSAGLVLTLFGMALIVGEAVRQIDAAFLELDPDPIDRHRPQPPAAGEGRPSSAAGQSRL